MSEPMTLAEALAYLKPDPANKGTISLKAPKAREAVEAIETALRGMERLLKVRKRSSAWSAESWCKAAEEALAGKPQSLRLRVDLYRAPPVDVVLSTGGSSHGQ